MTDEKAPLLINGTATNKAHRGSVNYDSAAISYEYEQSLGMFSLRIRQI